MLTRLKYAILLVDKVPVATKVGIIVTKYLLKIAAANQCLVFGKWLA